jgi:glycerophosphoryl diester phosphodiesterase
MHSSRLVAHRGHLAHHPENTRAALADALALGARRIELDVQLSRDGVPFLFHDRTLERLCRVSGAVHERTAAELATLRARTSCATSLQPLMRLDELPALLHEYPGAEAFVEIKRVALEQRGMEGVAVAMESALGTVLPRCIWISFSLDCLLYLRTRAARRIGAVIERWELRHDPRIAALRPEFLFCDLEGLPAEGRLEHAGAEVVIYEVDSAVCARALFDRGAHAIETFQFARLAQELGS